VVAEELVVNNPFKRWTTEEYLEYLREHPEEDVARSPAKPITTRSRIEVKVIELRNPADRLLPHAEAAVAVKLVLPHRDPYIIRDEHEVRLLIERLTLARQAFMRAREGYL
jgi:hypothetical protein